MSDKIELSPVVQAAIDQVLESTDPLDRPDFNVQDYINEMFPNEQALANIENVIGNFPDVCSSARTNM